MLSLILQASSPNLKSWTSVQNCFKAFSALYRQDTTLAWSRQARCGTIAEGFLFVRGSPAHWLLPSLTYPASPPYTVRTPHMHDPAGTMRKPPKALRGAAPFSVTEAARCAFLAARFQPCCVLRAPPLGAKAKAAPARPRSGLARRGRAPVVLRGPARGARSGAPTAQLLRAAHRAPLVLPLFVQGFRQEVVQRAEVLGLRLLHRLRGPLRPAHLRVHLLSRRLCLL